MTDPRDFDDDEDDFLDDDDEDETMPFGANSENAALHKEIKSKEAKAVKVQQDYEDTAERVRVMKEHLKNVQEEIKHAESVLTARKRDAEAENHLKILADNEYKRLDGEVRKHQAAIEAITDKLNSQENSIFKNNKRLEEVKAEMEWNQHQLDEWLAKTNEVDDDKSVLEKYQRADESRIKELTLSIEKLTAEATKLKSRLATEVTETHSQQLHLDKIAEAFRRTHAERQELITLWENSLAEMQARDEDIERAADEFQALRAETNARAAELREREEFVKQQQQENKEVEKEADVVERQGAKLRTMLFRDETQLRQFEDEVTSLRTTLSKVTSELHTKRAEANQMREMVEKKQLRQETLAKEADKAQDLAKQAHERKLTAEERAVQLEALANEEQAEGERLQRELQTIQAQRFKLIEQVQQLRREESLLQNANQGALASIRNIESNIRKLDEEVLQQQTMLYKQDFQIASLERKYANLEGKRTKEEQAEHDARISELKAQLEEQQKTQRFTAQQLKRAEDQLRVLRRMEDKVTADYERTKAKLEELELYNQSVEQQLAKETAAKEDLMVDENVLKLEIRRLRKKLNERADGVLSLEQNRQQLKMAMEERMHEIQIQKDLLAASVKAALDEKTAALKQVTARRTRIEQLKKRYQVTMMSLAPTEELQAGGSEITVESVQRAQVAIIVQQAQKREELQQKGDALDLTIRKSEKEIRALENTLRLMQGRNDKFKQTVKKADTQSDEALEKEELEGRFRTAMDKVKQKRQELAELQDEYAQLQATADDMTAEKRGLERNIQTLEADLSTLQAQLDDQEMKRQRAEKQASRLIARHREAKGGQDTTLEEQDFELRYLKDFNTRILGDLDNFAAQHPDLVPQLQMLYDRAGIQAPKRVPGSRGSSIAGSSVGSSRSSVASSRRSAASSRSVRAAGPSGPHQTAADAVARHSANRGLAVGTTTITIPTSASSQSPSRSSTRGSTRSRTPKK